MTLSRDAVMALAQGSPEWRKARAGSLGASQIADALAKTKAGWGASRENLQAQLIVERLTGLPVNGYVSQAMLDGIEREPDARAAYCFFMDCDVQQVGLVPHPHIAWTHASPDGLIGDVGTLEIKCPEPKAHLEFLLTGAISQKYLYQCQWQLCCTGRQWADFVSWHPDFPDYLQLYVQRVSRDGAMIAALEKDAVAFLAELDAKLAALNARFGQRAPAPLSAAAAELVDGIPDFLRRAS